MTWMYKTKFKNIYNKMKYNLKEELERYVRLSNYNPKLTLTENVNLVSEARILNPATSVREVESTLGKTMQQLAKELNIGMDAATITKLLEKDVASFEKEWAKALQKDLNSGVVVKGELGPLGKQLSKIELLRRLTTETKIKGGPLTVAEMDALKAEIKGANKLRAAKFQPKVKVEPNDPGTARDWGKKKPEIKNWDWKKLTKWGLAAGISLGALYLIYKSTHDDEPIPPVPPPVPPPTPKKYNVCPDTLPIKQYCENDTIRRVQGCLGIVTDGKFGPKTQEALEAKGQDGTTITTETITAVCGGGGGGETTTNDNTTGYEDYTTDEVETSTGQESTTTATDDAVEQ